MSDFDQKNQTVENQYNAGKIIFNSPPAPTEADLFKKGKKLLDAKSYEQAVKILEQCIEINPDNSETYYYLAIALLHGNNPKLMGHSTIRKIEKYLKTATRIEPKLGGAYVLWAIVKHDFYMLNGMYDRPPTYQDLLSMNYTLSQKHIQEIIEHVNSDNNPILQWLKKQI